MRNSYYERSVEKMKTRDYVSAIVYGSAGLIFGVALGWELKTAEDNLEYKIVQRMLVRDTKRILKNRYKKLRRGL